MRPVRIQRKRAKGWKMPPNTVYVGRPTKWGNVWRVNRAFCDCGTSDGTCLDYQARCHTSEAAVANYRTDIDEGLMPAVEEIQRELRGKDLACWCPLDQPCHADVLLEIANRRR